MGRELFAYWRVAAAAAPRAQAAAHDLQRRLRQQHPGLLARLYRRADSGGNTGGNTGGASVTLMETYAWPGRGIDAGLQAAIDAAAAAELATHCTNGRHVEVFDALDG